MQQTACMSPPAKPWVKPCLHNHTWRCCSGFRVRFDLQAYLKQLWVSRYHSLQEDVFGDGYHLLDPILENCCKLFFFNDNLLQNLCAYSSKKTFWPPACLIYYFLFFLKFGILIGNKANRRSVLTSFHGTRLISLVFSFLIWNFFLVLN